ncbi:ADP-ribosylglycohydrolase family protein [Geomonas sp.]|uniref:ADP-ribosylglycohydrolase family protein n=1 Tax=Geomonas sp. TaxID=2651584 RepID=UPI002B472F23|nr:ADP-ribosylglycohydrolase family protein [Geomonas sp.]HJV35771.1 ADP-ribosylglycohydrolase family protein [Geomonas sp.]
MDIPKGTNVSAMTDRCRGAIWGQFIGDAACIAMPALGTSPKGIGLFEQPTQTQSQEGKQPGELTHYGEAALLMLQSVAELGYFSAPDFGPRFIAHFSAEDYRGHLDQATKGTIDNYRAYVDKRPGASYHFQGGADDDQPSTLTRLAPVVVNRYQQESLLKVVEAAIRVCQDNQRAVVYAKCHALIIKELLLGNGLADAVKKAAKAVTGDGEPGKEIASAIEAVNGMLQNEVHAVTTQLGNGAALKSCFPAALHCALKLQDDFQQAILQTAKTGGECAARAALVGTWLGALHGVQGIPAEWRNRLKAQEEIEGCIEKIVAKVR